MFCFAAVGLPTSSNSYVLSWYQSESGQQKAHLQYYHTHKQSREQIIYVQSKSGVKINKSMFAVVEECQGLSEHTYIIVNKNHTPVSSRVTNTKFLLLQM